MTRTTNARIAGFTYLFYIAVAFPSMILSSRATGGEGTAERLASIAQHTSGYFRGWKRGQEIGGFAVGQRDRAAWEFNREQRAREATDQRARLS